MRYQRRHAGKVRGRLSTACERALDAWTRQQAHRHGVSISFVLAVCVSNASGIPIDGYDGKQTRKRKRGNR